MSYLVFVTFDLNNATVASYRLAYAELAKLGLKKVHVGTNRRNAVIPTTSVMGEFTGKSAEGVCNAIRERVQAVFRARRLRSEIFVVTGGDWAWAAGMTNPMAIAS